jgi:probable F420-dependent oxidoreductase
MKSDAPIRPFRFGASLFESSPSPGRWRSRVREVEDLGYDVLQVPDHLGMVSPFPALVSAADATKNQLGTYLLNAGVASPDYLARDVADVYRLTGGRLELGIGAGYAEAESAAVGRPFGSPGSRIQELGKVVRALRDLLAAEPDRPAPPILLGGAGNNLLDMAARSADIISFSIQAGMGPGTPEEAFATRVERVREAAGDRMGDIELNLFVAAVGERAGDVDLSVVSTAAGRRPEELVELPGVLVGPPQAIADRLRHYREAYGISYISVLEPHMRTFARVIALLR